MQKTNEFRRSKYFKTFISTHLKLYDKEDSLKGPSDLIMPLSKEYKESGFTSCVKDAFNILISHHTSTKKEINDAVIVLKILTMRYLVTFAQMHYCMRLLHFGLAGKEIPDYIRLPILLLAETISKSNPLKKMLNEQFILTSIYDNLLASLSDDKHVDIYILLTNILCNMGSTAKTSVYIPGESSEIEGQRRAFVKSGGFMLMMHLQAHSKSLRLRQHITSNILADIDSKLYSLQISELTRQKHIPEPTNPSIQSASSGNLIHGMIILGDNTPSIEFYKPILHILNLREISEILISSMQVKAPAHRSQRALTRKEREKEVKINTIYKSKRMSQQFKKHFNVLSAHKYMHDTLPSIKSITSKIEPTNAKIASYRTIKVSSLIENLKS